jgi:hypothetical protein
VSEPSKSLDLLGIKPVAEAIGTVTKGVTDGAGAFLSRICLPAAEEFGLLLRDKVGAWRQRNLLAIAARAEAMVKDLPNADSRHAHPRVVGSVMENGSWTDDDRVQEMWAGLLASACTESGRSEENLIYVSLLVQLTSSQAKILGFACTEARKHRSETGLIMTHILTVTTEQIMSASGTRDLHVLDLELDHLRGLELIDGGLSPDTIRPARLTPTSMGLQLYVRCQGYVGSPLEYFGL